MVGWLLSLASPSRKVGGKRNELFSHRAWMAPSLALLLFLHFLSFWMTTVRFSEWVQCVKCPSSEQPVKSAINFISQSLKLRYLTYPPPGTEKYHFHVCSHAVPGTMFHSFRCMEAWSLLCPNFPPCPSFYEHLGLFAARLFTHWSGGLNPEPGPGPVLGDFWPAYPHPPGLEDREPDIIITINGN